MNKLTIRYDPDHEWFTVIFPGDKQRNYGSLATLLSALKDYYGKTTTSKAHSARAISPTASS